MSATPTPAPNRFEWERALLASDLPATTRLVALVLATWAGADMKCWPSRPTIADRAGISVRTVATHLQRLRDHGWIRSRRGAPGRSNRYTLTVPVSVPEVVEFLEDRTPAAAAQAPSVPLPDQGPDHGSPTGGAHWSSGEALAAAIGSELDPTTRQRLNAEYATEPGIHRRLMEMLTTLARAGVATDLVVAAVTSTSYESADCVAACMHHRLKPLLATAR